MCQKHFKIALRKFEVLRVFQVSSRIRKQGSGWFQEDFKKIPGFCKGVSWMFCFGKLIVAFHSSQLSAQKEGLFNVEWSQLR